MTFLEEWEQFLIQEFVEVMRQRGHEIVYINDEILLESV